MKKYFELYSDEGFCYPLKLWKSKAIDSREDISLVEAEIVYNTEYFWCNEFRAFELKDEGGCGKECDYYDPRNGISGRCVHSKNGYVPTDKIVIVTRDGKIKSIR